MAKIRLLPEHIPTLEADTQQLRAIGHAMLALFNAAIIIAIVAVILSTRSGTPAIITAASNFVAWLIQQIVQPVQPAPPVTLGNSLEPAGSQPFDNGSGGTYNIPSQDYFPAIPTTPDLSLENPSNPPLPTPTSPLATPTVPGVPGGGGTDLTGSNTMHIYPPGSTSTGAGGPGG